jgi:hypothetical protein
VRNFTRYRIGGKDRVEVVTGWGCLTLKFLQSIRAAGAATASNLPGVFSSLLYNKSGAGF